jgi:hypothetical protein
MSGTVLHSFVLTTDNNHAMPPSSEGLKTISFVVLFTHASSRNNGEVFWAGMAAALKTTDPRSDLGANPGTFHVLAAGKANGADCQSHDYAFIICVLDYDIKVVYSPLGVGSFVLRLEAAGVPQAECVV